jgi:copper chaperone CopZ
MNSTIHTTIEGMHCGGCENKIRNALIKHQSITDASVSSTTGSAEVHTTGEINDDSIRDAITGAGDYRVTAIHRSESTSTPLSPAGAHQAPADDSPPENLYPLFLIVGFITGVTLLVAWSTADWRAEPMMRHFMAGFFIVFSFFKLLDPPGFVSAYRGYDLLARKSNAWAWAYPYVELGLGVMYLMAWVPVVTNIITLILMLIGAIGVLKALLDKRAIRCACLGTALNLPMTKVTLVEDLTMALMATVMILLML